MLLQQRAPPCVGRQRAFAEELAGWLAGRGAAAVVALCGLDAGMRRDGQLEGPPLRWGWRGQQGDQGAWNEQDAGRSQ